MRAIADAVDEITPVARDRLDRAMRSVASPPPDEDFAALVARRDELLAYA